MPAWSARSIDAEVLLSANLPPADAAPYGTPGLAQRHARSAAAVRQPADRIEGGERVWRSKCRSWRA